LIERKYQFNTEIRRKTENQDAWELLIVGCQKNIFDIVERELRNMLIMQKVRSFSSDYLHGLKQSLEANMKSFEHEIELVQTKTETSIQLMNFTSRVVSNKSELFQASNNTF
jgi:hypothetical protein